MAFSKVLVAGSINMDIVARVELHPRLGETVFGKSLHFFPGGKGANQAVAAAKLGAQTSIIGMVGNDDFGDQLEQFLTTQGVDVTNLHRTPEVTTGAALIVVSETSDNSIVVIPGANNQLKQKEIENISIGSDILVSQFEIPMNIIETFFAKGKTSGTINILNPAPARQFPADLLALVDIIIVNERELAFFLRLNERNIDNSAETLRAAARKLQTHSKQSIVVTLGKKGAYALIGEKGIEIRERTVNAIDTTGAGDCFVGAVAAKLAEENSLEDALYYANAAASICVQRPGAGTSMPTRSEVLKVL